MSVFFSSEKGETMGKGKRYEEKQIVQGVFQGNVRGFGFVAISEEEELFISKEDRKDAMDQDIVEVQIKPHTTGKRREGKVLKVLARNTKILVGEYQKSGRKKYGFVIPDDSKVLQDIFVPHHAAQGAKDGDKVVVELTSYGEKGRKPEGKIQEVLGHKSQTGMDITALIRSREKKEEFPERVKNRANKTSDKVVEGDFSGRKDFRNWQIVTIDGEDAKDLDDGVSLTREEGGYQLGVHIADVANYVQENSAVDQEARARGTSVYLPDRVIPMLPTVLSNGICSLNAGEERLALSCIMHLNEKGNLLHHEIVESVILVKKRLSYTEVEEVLEGKRELEPSIQEMLAEMGALSRILTEKRKHRGGIDFDFPEPKILLNEEGKVSEILLRERNQATKLIENFMILANETVAGEYFWRNLPFLYRNHERPTEEKTRELIRVLGGMGYKIRKKDGSVSAKEAQKLLEKVKGKEEEAFVHRLVLQSMQQAKYGEANQGHYGLASECYTHFTSPIRRYPDLQIHRIIKDTIRGRMKDEKVAHYEALLPQVAKESSLLERRAVEMEREVEKMKKAEYMNEQVGEYFQGRVSGFHKWGMYVELPNTVEGMIPLSSFVDDYYTYEEEKGRIIGKRSQKTFSLGQKVWVQVVGANKRLGTIDFRWVGQGEEEWEHPILN